jgi:predicted RNA-binding protein
MCEADAFLLGADGEERLLENVDELEVQGEEIRLVNIFGEQKILRARLRSYHSGERRILLEPLSPSPTRAG